MSSVLNDALRDFGLANLGHEAVERALQTALRRGGALAELFFEESLSTRISYEASRVDRVSDGIDRGVGLRVLFDNRSVYGYTTDLTEPALVRLAEALAEAVDGGVPSRLSQRVIEWAWSWPGSQEIAEYRVVRSPRQASLEEKIAIAKRADAGARAELPAARQVSISVMDTLRNILVVNSDGVISRDKKTYLTLIAQVVGEKAGRVESAYEVDGGYVGLEYLDDHPPEAVGRGAARRVRILLDAKPAPAGTMAVVIDSEAGGTMIHEAVGHGLEADLACNGLSVYQGKVGQAVASPLVTVVDDGTIPAKRGSFAMDDEGTPSRKNTLIENGVLKGYLVDRISAMKFDLPATGNGRRESFRHKPIVRMTNTYVAPGKDAPEAILRDTKRGIFVKAMGGGEVNTVSGDFVFAVTEGYLIEDGRLGAAIRGATLVGNGPRALSLVDRVGTDLGYRNGTCGKDGQGAPVTSAQPTLRIPELTVGGEVPAETYWPASSR